MPADTAFGHYLDIPSGSDAITSSDCVGAIFSQAWERINKGATAVGDRKGLTEGGWETRPFWRFRSDPRPPAARAETQGITRKNCCARISAIEPIRGGVNGIEVEFIKHRGAALINEYNYTRDLQAALLAP